MYSVRNGILSYEFKTKIRKNENLASFSSLAFLRVALTRWIHAFNIIYQYHVCMCVSFLWDRKKNLFAKEHKLCVICPLS